MATTKTTTPGAWYLCNGVKVYITPPTTLVMGENGVKYADLPATRSSKSFYAGLVVEYTRKLAEAERLAPATGNTERVARLQVQLDRLQRLAAK